MALTVITWPLIQSAWADPRPADNKPNIVFFLVDDLGWADLGYNGATYHLTPKLENGPNILFIVVDDLGWADGGC